MQLRLVRLYCALIAVYLGPLVVAIALFHLGRFNWAAPITYGFFTIAGGMTIAALWHLVRRTGLGPAERAGGGTSDRAAPGVVRLWMWLVTAILGAWGLVLFVLPHGPWPQIWVWPQDPLTSRLIASMLLTLAAGAALSLSSGERARLMLWMSVAYGAGVTAAGLMNKVAGKPVPITYVTAFAVLALISLCLLACVRRGAAGSPELR